jgi:hypothetical protein
MAMAEQENEANNIPEDPDAQLMLAFQKGGASAFEALLRRNYRNVLNFIYRFMGRRDIAEDLTHEVFHTPMMVSGHKTRSVFDRYDIVNETDLKLAAQKQPVYLDTQKTAQFRAQSKKKGGVRSLA